MPAATSKRVELGDAHAYIEGEVTKLEQAIAAGSDVGMEFGCAVTTVSLKRITGDLAKKIERLCYVEVPRIQLRKAVAEAKQNAKYPDLGDLGCFQLFASDAIEAADRHPSRDAELTVLAAEYANLCPKEVEKIRARAPR